MAKLKIVGGNLPTSYRAIKGERFYAERLRRVTGAKTFTITVRPNEGGQVTWIKVDAGDEAKSWETARKAVEALDAGRPVEEVVELCGHKPVKTIEVEAKPTGVPSGVPFTFSHHFRLSLIGNIEEAVEAKDGADVSSILKQNIDGKPSYRNVWKARGLEWPEAEIIKLVKKGASAVEVVDALQRYFETDGDKVYFDEWQKDDDKPGETKPGKRRAPAFHRNPSAAEQRKQTEETNAKNRKAVKTAVEAVGIDFGRVYAYLEKNKQPMPESLVRRLIDEAQLSPDEIKRNQEQDHAKYLRSIRELLQKQPKGQAMSKAKDEVEKKKAIIREIRKTNPTAGMNEIAASSLWKQAYGKKKPGGRLIGQVNGEDGVIAIGSAGKKSKVVKRPGKTAAASDGRKGTVKPTVFPKGKRQILAEKPITLDEMKLAKDLVDEAFNGYYDNAIKAINVLTATSTDLTLTVGRTVAAFEAIIGTGVDASRLADAVQGIRELTAKK